MSSKPAVLLLPLLLLCLAITSACQDTPPPSGDDDDTTADDDDAAADDDDSSSNDDDDSSSNGDDDDRGDDDDSTPPCEEDPYAGDNTCTSEGAVLVEGQPVQLLFCEDTEDWVRFNGCSGRSYSIEVRALGADSEPIIELLSPDCGMLLSSSDSSTPIVWTATDDGLFHVRVHQADDKTGPETGYEIEVLGNTEPCSTWARNLSTPRKSLAADIAPYWDGGSVVAGFLGDQDGGSPMAREGWLARLNSRGEILWDRSYAGSSGSEFSGVLPTSDGGAVAFGRIHGASPSEGSAWALSVSAAGEPSWSNRYSLGSESRFVTGAVSPGGVILGGTSVNSSGTPRRGWFLELDPAGQVLWERLLEIGDGFTLVDLAPGPAGGLYLLGTVVDDSAAESSLQLLYLASDGSPQWDRRIGGSGSDTAGGLASFPDGRVAVTGTTRSYSNHPTGLKSDVWVLLFDSSGNLSWQRVFGDHVDDDVGVAVEVSGAEELRVLASTGSFGNLFKSDYWLLAIAAADGELLWQRAYRGQNHDQPRALALAPSGAALLAGATASYSIPAGTDEAWVLKLAADGMNSCSFLLDTNSQPLDESVAITTSAPSITSTTSESSEFTLTQTCALASPGEQCFEEIQ